MEELPNTNVSEFTGNIPAFVMPDFTAIAWQRGQPDLMSIPYRQLKQLMLQARKYDPRAIEAFCNLAEPVLQKYSHLPYIVSALGIDEARSIVNQTLMDFLMHEHLRDDRQDIPTMLKRAIHCDLKNQVDRMKTRRQFEQHSKPASQSEDDEEETDVTASLPADKRLEPDSQVLQKERRYLVRECLLHLSPKEKVVINGIFFKQQSVSEIAEELHCSTLSVSTAKYSALKKLHKLFEEKHVA